MSGVAVGSAVLATAIAVDGVATVGFTLATTLSVISAVGAVTSAIGVLTHNQTLAIAGGVIGAVGAIGGLASAAGVFAEGGIFGSAAGAPSAAGAGADVGTLAADAGAGSIAAGTNQVLIDAGLEAGQQSAGISSSVMSGTDILNEVSGAVVSPGSASAEVGGSLVNSADPATGSVVGSDVTPVTATDTGVTGATPGTASADSTAVLESQGAGPEGVTTSVAAPAAPDAPAAPGTPAEVTGVNNSTSPITGAPENPLDAGIRGSYAASQKAVAIQNLKTGPTIYTPGSNSFSDVWNFVKGNPGALYGTIQAGGALIGGATDSLKPAQINALNAQANANQAAANLSAQQLSNINGPIPTARRVPPGLVNQPAVTGQVAA